MKQLSPLKPWARIGITKEQYKKLRPWKKAKMSRERFESIILHVSQEIIDEHRREAEASALIEQIFGKEIGAD